MLFHADAYGGGVEIVGRRRLTKPEARRAMVKEMLILRRAGFTDAEIGLKYRYRRETVNRMINSIPEAQVERLHAIGLA
jgi:hypothetical protein